MIASPPRQLAPAPPTWAATSGRGLVPGLSTPHPMGQFLPELFQEDSFALRLAAALDEVLAPIFSTLDNLDAYFDPWLAPQDFLDWLGSWVGLPVDETWPVDRRRASVAQAYELFRLRGTGRGLKAHIEIYTGGTVEIIDTGGIATSTTAGAALPGSPNFALLVRVVVDDPDSIRRDRLEALVAAAKPAHVTHRIEIIKRSEASQKVEVTSG
jgi:phage tail-like protein